MPDVEQLVINTGPLLALLAATGSLQVLQPLYRRVLVPLEVTEEIRAGGPNRFGVAAFEEATWLERHPTPARTGLLLGRMLDRGEAAVIQMALDEEVETVCIDEPVGRRVARLNGLKVTGSIGVLLRAKRQGAAFLMADAIARMRSKGIWLGDDVVGFALREAGER